MKQLTKVSEYETKSVIFIEELDPVRKRRIINKSRSLLGIIPSKKTMMKFGLNLHWREIFY